MTVIAFRDGIMACDSQVSIGDYRTGMVKKITRLECGALVGFAGDVDCRDGLQLLEKKLEKGKFPTVKELEDLTTDVNFLIALPDGEMYECQTGKNRSFLECGWHGYEAIGSGKYVALGAMDAGASAEEACTIACHRVDGCGLPVFTMPLELPKKRKRVK